jgi:hypothetical protein
MTSFAASAGILPSTNCQNGRRSASSERLARYQVIVLRHKRPIDTKTGS